MFMPNRASSLNAAVVYHHMPAFQPAQHVPSRSEVNDVQVIGLSREGSRMKYILWSDDTIFIENEFVRWSNKIDHEIRVGV